MPPCEPWCTEADMCPPCDAYDYDGAPDLQTAIDIASSVLYNLSPTKYPGHCTRTIRPCARATRRSTAPAWRDAVAGWRQSWGFCGCNVDDRCGCGSTPQIELAANVVAITEVKIDGDLLDPSEYRLDERRMLVRLADADRHNTGWPCCQRLDLPDTEEGTWSVTFTHGRRPPPDGVRAAAVLACQLAISCDPDRAGDCQLPKRVTSITRQGLAVAMAIDPQDFLDQGRTGLYEVDLFLSGQRAKSHQGSAVLSPDLPPFGRRIG